MTRYNFIFSLVVTGLVATISFVLVTGCLSTTEEDFTGTFGPPGRLQLHTVPSGDTPDNGGGDIGPNCWELKECVCDPLEDDSDYESCVQAVSVMSEAQCADLLDDYECDDYYYGDDDDDYYPTDVDADTDYDTDY